MSATDPPDEDDAAAPGSPPVRAMLARFTARTIDALFPPVCRTCLTPVVSDHTLCAACWRQIRFIQPPLCDRLGIPLTHDTGGPQVSAAALANPPLYARARAVGLFSGPLRELIHNLKFHDRLDQRRLLAMWMCAAGDTLIADADLVVPVPLDRWRLLWRRYNQAALLALEVGRIRTKPVDPLALQRIKTTRPQVGLSEVQRRENVRAAFRVPASHRARVAGKRVLLIDDVVTTGATVDACARALLRAGAANVDVLAAALVANH